MISQGEHSYFFLLLLPALNINNNKAARYTITKEEHKLNYYMFNSLSTLPTFKELTKYFRYGDMLFKDIDVKNHVYDIFNFMGIR